MVLWSWNKQDDNQQICTTKTKFAGSKSLPIAQPPLKDKLFSFCRQYYTTVKEMLEEEIGKIAPGEDDLSHSRQEIPEAKSRLPQGFPQQEQ